MTVKISFSGKIFHSNEMNMTNYLIYNSLEVIKILPLIRNLFKMNRFPREQLGTVYQKLGRINDTQVYIQKPHNNRSESI